MTLVTTRRPFHLHCSIDADNPDELARVLREIAAEIDIQHDADLAGAGEVMLEIAGGTSSNWYVRIDHDLDRLSESRPGARLGTGI